MKLLHLVHTFPPESSGGTERYVEAIAKEQAARGDEVAVFAGRDARRGAQDPACTQERQDGVRVVRFAREAHESYGVLFRPDAVLARVVERVRDFAPDLVHVHHWFQLHDRLVQALAPHAPVVATFHDSYVLCPRFFLVRPDGALCHARVPVPVERCVECVAPEDGDAALDARLEERARSFRAEIAALSLATFPSAHHAAVLRRSGWFADTSTEVLPLGVADPPAAPSHRPAPGRLRLVCFGHLSRLKGVDLLLDALAELPPAERERVELHLHGRVLPEDEAFLRSRVRTSAVTFHGPYGPEGLRDVAGGYDLAVFPSRAEETYSLVVEEAVALGLPVLTSDRGALPERAEGAGRAVPLDGPAAWAARIGELLRRPEELEAWRRGLRSPASLAEHLQRLGRCYREVLHDPRQRRGA